MSARSLLLVLRRPPTCTLFPYTTLFRSHVERTAIGSRPRRFRQSALQQLFSGSFALVRRRAFDSMGLDRKSTRLNSSHLVISYAVFCLKKKTKKLLCSQLTEYEK